MDPALPPLSVCLAMVCLLGAARLSSGDTCPCLPIPPLPLTKPPPDECRQINSTFRYSCADGYKRQAGTSNRIKCVLKNGAVVWEPSNLVCIRDPTRPATQQPTTTTDTSAATKIPPHIVTTVGSTTATSATSPPRSRGIPTEGGEGTEGSPHDAVTQTTVRTPPVETSTSSGNDPPQAFGGSAQAAVISVAALAIVCGLAGVACLLYRRRSRSRTAKPPAQESVPMNPPPGLTTDNFHHDSP